MKISTHVEQFADCYDISSKEVHYARTVLYYGAYFEEKAKKVLEAIVKHRAHLLPAITISGERIAFLPEVQCTDTVEFSFYFLSKIPALIKSEAQEHPWNIHARSALAQYFQEYHHAVDKFMQLVSVRAGTDDATLIPSRALFTEQELFDIGLLQYALPVVLRNFDSVIVKSAIWKFLNIPQEQNLPKHMLQNKEKKALYIANREHNYFTQGILTEEILREAQDEYLKQLESI